MRFIVLASLVLSCGGAGLERPTIAQGVYGEGAVELDVAGPRGLVKSTRARGFFEIALDEGDYRVCVSADRCSPVHVGRGQVVRLDYGAGASRL